MKVEKLFSLNPNRSLIDGSFEGYKLSFDNPAVSSQELSQGVWQVESSANNFSYLHTRLLTLHNHLHSEPENDVVYYFSSDKRIRAASFSKDSPSGDIPEFVYDLSASSSGLASLDGEEFSCMEPNCQPSLVFVSDRLAVFSDGRGILTVADTGDRSHPSTWKAMFQCTSAEIFTAGLSGSPGFHVLSAATSSSAPLEHSSPWKLHVLICHVADGGAPSGASSNYLTVATIDVAGQCWRAAGARQLRAPGTVLYSALELSPATDSHSPAELVTRPVHLLLATDKPVSFFPACQNGNGGETACKPTDESEENGYGCGELGSLYVWSQSDAELRVCVRVPPAALDEDASSRWKMLLSPQAVTVATESCELLRLHLFDALKTDTDAAPWWSREESDGSVCLKFLLRKAVVERRWPVLASEVTGSWTECGPARPLGHETPNAELLESAALCLQLLSRTVPGLQDSQPPPGSSVSGDVVEECDSMPDDSCVLLRLDVEKQLTTYQCSLGAHQYVMTSQLTLGEPPAFCLRHDVDGLLWQPGFSSDNKSWQCEHIGTLNAFGYIQASKTQRKFSLAPPDMSFAAVCDVSRHVYIYRQPEPMAGEVKHRLSGRRVTQISRQHVVSLDDQQPVLGAVAFNHALVLLTDKYLHYVELK